MFHHRPIFCVDDIIAHYEKRDGVPIKYVCTSALGHEAFAGDIFYRDTPHPEYGNRYFRIFEWNGGQHIQSADSIENEEFTMVRGREGWGYSQHRHDFHVVQCAGISIDGGRSYFKIYGDVEDIENAEIKAFVVKDGNLEEVIT